MKRNLFLSCFIALAALTACSNSDNDGPANNAEQVFEINVSNAGGNALARAGRPLYGSQASQAVDHVVVYVKDTDNKVVFVKVLNDWPTISTDYANGKRHTFKLTGDDKLGAGTYTLAAFAYSDGAAAPEVPTVGGVTEGLTVDYLGKAEEIFAGESELTVAGAPLYLAQVTPLNLNVRLPVHLVTSPKYQRVCLKKKLRKCVWLQA